MASVVLKSMTGYNAAAPVVRTPKKQIVVSNGEPKMNTVPKSRVGKRVIHVMCFVKNSR